MVRLVARGVVVGLSVAAAWIAAAPTRAWAEPEIPPAAFVPAPPDHQPGSSQYVPPSETEPPPRAASDDSLPGFMTLDRTSTGPHAGIQVSFNKFDDTSLSDAFAMRFNPFGQFIFPNRVAGIYGQLPISHVFNFNGEDGTGVGNIEMGGLYLPMGDSRLILRAGLALPTASDSGEGFGANASTILERLTDFVLFTPDYTTFRLSASTVQRMDMFFFRADGGFDLVFSRPSADDGPSVFFRANVAGGIRTSVVDFSLELVNFAAVNGDVTGGITERFLHTLALGVRTQGIDQFHFGTVFPLDEATRGEVWILSLGYLRAFN